MKLENLTLVLPDGCFKGSFTIGNGHFVNITKDAIITSTLPEGLTVVPGLVDLHGDMLEREIEPRPGSRFPDTMSIREVDKRHAAAGVTTAYIALSFADYVELEEARLEERTRELVTSINDLRSDLGCDTRIHARFEIIYPDTKEMLKELISKGHVHLVSLMDHSPGQGQFRDLENYISYMAEWMQVSRQDAQNEIERNTKEPVSWENIRDLSELALAHALPIASHDDDTSTKVKVMNDFDVSISEFPVTLEGAQTAKDLNMYTVMGAPNALRGKSHSGNLSALEALKAGLLDALASDYYPAAMLQSVFTITNKGILEFHDAIKLVSENPAKAANISDRGRIAEGLRADFVVLEPRSQSVIATFSKGKLIYWSGHYKEELSALL